MSLRFFFILLCLSAFSSGALAQDTTGDEAPVEDPVPAPAETTPAPAPTEPEPEPAPSSSSSSTSSDPAAASSATAAPPTPAPTPAPAPAPEPAPAQQAEPAPVIHPAVGTSSPQAQPAAQQQEEDDGRDADFLWLEVGFGYSWADLAAFSNNNFVPGVQQLKGSGYAGHAAAGFKLFIFTFGARGTVASYPGAERPFDLWSLMFDLGLRIPILFAEPYIRAGIGYAWLGSIDFTSVGDSSVSVYGLTIEAGAGIDIYLGKFVSLGAGFDLAFLNLTRQRLDNCMSTGGAMCDVGGVDLQEEGDSVGFQVRATGHIAFHF